MINRRDVVVAVVSVFATAATMLCAQNAAKSLMRSSVFRWSELKVEQTKVGERRPVFDAPTANLTRFECHITTLNPGEMPHAAHRHPHEELMIVKEGALEAEQNGVTHRVEAGGIIFEGSNDLHGLRNVGNQPATYFVLAWYPHDLTGTEAK